MWVWESERMIKRNWIEERKRKRKEEQWWNFNHGSNDEEKRDEKGNYIKYSEDLLSFTSLIEKRLYFEFLCSLHGVNPFSFTENNFQRSFNEQELEPMSKLWCDGLIKYLKRGQLPCLCAILQWHYKLISLSPSLYLSRSRKLQCRKDRLEEGKSLRAYTRKGTVLVAEEEGWNNRSVSEWINK